MENNKLAHELTMLFLQKNTVSSLDPSYYLNAYFKTLTDFKELLNNSSDKQYQEWISEHNG